MNAPASAAEQTATKPRVEGDREAEIFDGVLKVLVEVGYDRMTFDAVAAEVRASKATLYKRWPTKADLLVSAVEHVFDQMRAGQGIPDTGTLAGDLEQTFCHSGDGFDRMTEVAAAALPAVTRDAELNRIFSERFMKPRNQELYDLMKRAQDRGEIGRNADLDLLATVLPAMKFHHMLTTGECPAPNFAAPIIEQILLPACRASVTAEACGQQPS